MEELIDKLTKERLSSSNMSDRSRNVFKKIRRNFLINYYTENHMRRFFNKCWLHDEEFRSVFIGEDHSEVGVDVCVSCFLFENPTLENIIPKDYLNVFKYPYRGGKYGVNVKVDPSAINDTGYLVYFILVSGYIKIGFTKELPSRIIALQIGCPVVYEKIYYMEGNSTVEANLHRKFKKFRVCGEWFISHKYLVDYISSHCVEFRLNDK